MTRTWGLVALLLASLLAGLTPYFSDLAIGAFGRNRATAIMYAYSVFVPVLWIPLMGLAIHLYGKRAAWLLLTAPLAFVPSLPFVFMMWWYRTQAWTIYGPSP